MSDLSAYHELIARKRVAFEPRGMKNVHALNSALKPHQAHCVDFALRAGRAGHYLDCVAGETIIETIEGPDRIDSLAAAGRPISVWSIGDDLKPNVSQATAPFAKGIGHLYEVKTRGGRSIMATGRHKFRSESGWIFCEDIVAGTRLLVSDRLHVPPRYCSVEWLPWSFPFVDTVVSVSYAMTSTYYDMHVPGDENYFAQGFWNHNTGLGKSFAALEYGRVIVEATNKPVLMLAPLAVGPQHQREAERWGIDAVYRREPNESDRARIVITNYERVDHFETTQFAGIILDEASILKSFTGVTTRKLIETFANTPFRLAATATPAPNDHMELGQQSQFLGVMRSNEMLSRWFIADQSQMGRYRIKRAAVGPFWEWVASWARCISKPSDVGFSDDGYVLPDLITHRHIVESDRTGDVGAEKDGQARMFRMPEMSATSIHREKRFTAKARAERLACIVKAEPHEAWMIWSDTDYEADALLRVLPDAVEVRGSMLAAVKERKLDSFSRGEARILISKPSVCGYGLNWQHCARVAFVGLSFSYENYYQAIRRCWRFGQTRPVHVHVVCADTEAVISDVIARKSGDHEAMKTEMTAAMARAVRSSSTMNDYIPKLNARLPAWMERT
jgi:hypothetical protein